MDVNHSGFSAVCDDKYRESPQKSLLEGGTMESSETVRRARME
jgi:hypothetical protein